VAIVESPELAGWLRYLEDLHPRKIDLGLARLSTVATRLGLLPATVPVLTVAGTNGKGTVARCATALLMVQGLRVGTYTSPHLLRYNERIAVDGAAAADAEILSAFTDIEAARGDISLTYFEFATLAALLVFRAREVQVMVLEVGLGGRLDAVNSIDPDVAVITRIGLDHQQWLGDTVEKIAVEKAGIMRRGRPVVIADPAAPGVLDTAARAVSARVERAGREWHWQVAANGALELDQPDAAQPDAARLRVPLPPGLQAMNVAAAVRAVSLLCGRVDGAQAQQALAGLPVPGRLQHLDLGSRELVLDVAHNPDSAEALAAHLRDLSPARTVAVFGAMADKDVDGILAPLAGLLDGVILTALPDTPRAASTAALTRSAQGLGLRVLASASCPESAWGELQPLWGEGTRAIVFGSFHTVGGIMRALMDSPAAQTLEQTWIPR
jgi:dihydrofolate synthase/folylpolyglutamate synthase